MGPRRPDPTAGRLRLGLLVPLRHRDFRLLAGGSLVSLLGDGVFRVSIAIQVLAVRNDPWALSLVAASWATAQFLTLPAGGWAADRFPRRSVMVVADGLRCAALGVLGLLSVGGALDLWHLCALGAVVGMGNGLFNPTAMSFVPDLLPAADLERGNAFLGAARPLMLWILGPALGAWMVGLGGPGAALGFDAATFGVSALFLLAIRVRPGTAGGDEPRGFRRTARDLAEALRFVRARRWAWAWISAAGVSTMLHSGAFEVLLPTLLVNDLGLDQGAAARALAAAFAAGGAGSIAASTVLAQYGIPRRFLTLLFACEAAALLCTAGYGLVTGSWHVAVLGLGVFTLFALTDVIATTLLQRLVPRRLLGRVASLDWMSSVGLAPLGFILAGPLGALVGPRAGIVALGLGGFVLVLGLALVPGVRAAERAGPLRELHPEEVAPPAPVREAPGLDGQPPAPRQLQIDQRSG